MDPFPEESNLSPTLTFLVDILFVVVIAASFVFYGDYLFRPSASPVIFAGLVTVYLMAITSWIGYHSHITEYPYTDSTPAKARFGIHLALVALCAYLLYSLGTAQATPNLSPFLWGFPIIVVLHLISRRIRQKEYVVEVAEPEAAAPEAVERETRGAEAIEREREATEQEVAEWEASELEAIEQDLLYTYLSGFIAICLVYQFIVLPAITATYGGLNWAFIFLPLLAGIAYQRVSGPYLERKITAPPPPAPTPLPKRRIVNFRRRHGLPPPGSLAAAGGKDELSGKEEGAFSPSTLIHPLANRGSRQGRGK